MTNFCERLFLAVHKVILGYFLANPLLSMATWDINLNTQKLKCRFGIFWVARAKPIRFFNSRKNYYRGKLHHIMDMKPSLKTKFNLKTVKVLSETWFPLWSNVFYWNSVSQFLHQATTEERRDDIRGGSRTAATSKMERFVITVNGFQPLTIITKHTILVVSAVLDRHRLRKSRFFYGC